MVVGRGYGGEEGVVSGVSHLAKLSRAPYMALVPSFPLRLIVIVVAPPIEVPQIMSNMSEMGSDVRASSACSTSMILKPLIPPPSIARIRSGRAGFGALMLLGRSICKSERLGGGSPRLSREESSSSGIIP